MEEPLPIMPSLLPSFAVDNGVDVGVEDEGVGVGVGVEDGVDVDVDDEVVDADGECVEDVDADVGCVLSTVSVSVVVLVLVALLSLVLLVVLEAFGLEEVPLNRESVGSGFPLDVVSKDGTNVGSPLIVVKYRGVITTPDIVVTYGVAVLELSLLLVVRCVEEDLAAGTGRPLMVLLPTGALELEEAGA